MVRAWATGVLLASVVLAGCGGGEEDAAREGPTPEQTTSEQTEPTTERTFTGTPPEGVTVGRTTVDRPSPDERRQSEAALLECQLKEAERDLGREGLGVLMDEIADELVARPDTDSGQLLAERGYTCGNLASP